VDIVIEKVAYSAFYMTRLEWVLRKLGISQLVVAGIVTNGGVASTVRDAHVRDIDAMVLEDGCGAFSPTIHQTAIDALRPVARIATIADMLAELG
jgi:nicotinamidase-related amidase